MVQSLGRSYASGAQTKFHMLRHGNGKERPERPNFKGFLR